MRTKEQVQRDRLRRIEANVLHERLRRIETKLDASIRLMEDSDPCAQQGRALDIDAAYQASLDFLMGYLEPHEAAQKIRQLLRPYITMNRTIKEPTIQTNGETK